MAYFVAKELHLRPMDILTNWGCEELLVAYANYANQHTQESFEMMDKKERAKKKITELDRWAMPFVTMQQAEELVNYKPQTPTDADEMQRVADMLFS